MRFVLALSIYTLVMLLTGFWIGWVGHGDSQGEGR